MSVEDWLKRRSDTTFIFHDGSMGRVYIYLRERLILIPCMVNKCRDFYNIHGCYGSEKLKIISSWNLSGCLGMHNLHNLRVCDECLPGWTFQKHRVFHNVHHFCSGSLSIWWFQPIWKILYSQIGSFPQGSGVKIKKICELPPPNCVFGNDGKTSIQGGPPTCYKL